MNLAYVLMDTEVGRDREIQNHLKKIPGVEEIHHIYGEHDQIVKARCNNQKELDACLKKIKRTDGVGHTLILRVVDEI